MACARCQHRLNKHRGQWCDACDPWARFEHDTGSRAYHEFATQEEVDHAEAEAALEYAAKNGLITGRGIE